MKIERLLGIVTYLMNRELVTCKQLAEKFEVTERTIQRDVESINMAGIPITAIRGMNGGYKILDTYGFSKQASHKNELESIRMALESLGSALEDEVLSSTLEKVTSLGSTKNNSVNIDFSIAKENKHVSSTISIVKAALSSKKMIDFDYTNANHFVSSRFVEPVSLEFKWYAWYMIGFLNDKKTYRVFKIVRMSDVKTTNQNFSGEHDATNLFDQLMKQDTRETVAIKFECESSIVQAVKEYLPNVMLTDGKNDKVVGEFTVVESERLWFAFLLSFGDQLKVTQPEQIKQRLIDHSRNIINQYEKI